MKYNTRIPNILESFYYEEFKSSEKACRQKHYPEAWLHLKPAHIIGQYYFFEHNYAQWKLLLFGISIKNTKEVIGRIPRLLLGGVKSFVGKIPVSNTGGANVPPLKSMEIPQDIQQLINSVK